LIASCTTRSRSSGVSVLSAREGWARNPCGIKNEDGAVSALVELAADAEFRLAADSTVNEAEGGVGLWKPSALSLRGLEGVKTVVLRHGLWT
jgi:hypothetical protein